MMRRAGRGVKLEGLGSYLPKIALDGTFDVSHRLDRAIKNALNAPGTFTGNIKNRANPPASRPPPTGKPPRPKTLESGPPSSP